jgi:hypothetical protein
VTCNRAARGWLDTHRHSSRNSSTPRAKDLRPGPCRHRAADGAGRRTCPRFGVGPDRAERVTSGGPLRAPWSATPGGGLILAVERAQRRPSPGLVAGERVAELVVVDVGESMVRVRPPTADGEQCDQSRRSRRRGADRRVNANAVEPAFEGSERREYRTRVSDGSWLSVRYATPVAVDAPGAGTR